MSIIKKIPTFSIAIFVVVSWSVNVCCFFFVSFRGVCLPQIKSEDKQEKGNSKTYTYRRVAVTPYAPYSPQKHPTRFNGDIIQVRARHTGRQV